VGSGGKNKELCSKGGNRELRADLYLLAVRNITVDKNDKARHPIFRDYYLKKLMERK